MNTSEHIEAVQVPQPIAEVVGSTPAGCTFTEEKRSQCSKGVANALVLGAAEPLITIDSNHLVPAIIVLVATVLLAVLGGFFLGARWGERREHNRLGNPSARRSILHRIH